MKTLKSGDVLPNGATVIESTKTVVLAQWDKNSNEYITWNYNYIDGEPSCYWGHYHESITKAVEDYNQRVANS